MVPSASCAVHAIQTERWLKKEGKKKKKKKKIKKRTEKKKKGLGKKKKKNAPLGQEDEWVGELQSLISPLPTVADAIRSAISSSVHGDILQQPLKKDERSLRCITVHLTCLGVEWFGGGGDSCGGGGG